MSNTNRELAGTVGVDAGMVWVGDPCHVLGQDSIRGPKTWDEFCDKVQAAGHWGRDAPGYSKPLGEGIGLAVTSGDGDGVYPVYVTKDDSGRVTKIEILFGGEDD